MRILSQDGLDGVFDFPYDKCIVYIYGDMKTIKLCPIGEPDSEYTVAKYTTKAKALKAMEMLREEYQFAKEFETICCGTTDYTSKPKYSFLFPSDEEIEV